jgi:ppGpp synthetase/RelA/SpoT-type nucleotidyltranferase
VCLKCDKRGGMTLYQAKIKSKDLQGLRSILQPLEELVNLWEHSIDRFQTYIIKIRGKIQVPSSQFTA